MTAAKLIKKHEPIMCIGIKNDKDTIYNIKRSTLYFLAVVLLVFSGFTPYDRVEKSWVVVIDPGHGGKDPGAVGSISHEKNITLAIALKTGEYIEKNLKNVRVIYTRKNDAFVDLDKRADIANKNKADLFISIHVNSSPSRNIRGTETYIMGLHKDKENLEVAMKENEVILLETDYSTKYENFDPKSPESYIMFTLMQNTFQKQSTDLASRIQTQYKDRVTRVDRGVKQAGFWVLFMTTMPSVLTETGFISNVSEERYLNTKEGQEYIASAIYRACREYVDEIERRTDIAETDDHNNAIKTNNSFSGTAEKSKITYMVQVSTSSGKTEIRPENFKGLKNITEIFTSDRYRYAAGSFDDYDEAANYRKQIESFFPDAFVIAVKDNKILPLREALKLNNY
jgi:N-acetylmuramoyl-L-alanine amidase